MRALLQPKAVLPRTNFTRRHESALADLSPASDHTPAQPTIPAAPLRHVGKCGACHDKGLTFSNIRAGQYSPDKLPPSNGFSARAPLRLPASSSTYMSFREPLPPGCPPVESREITSDLVVFRIIRAETAANDDFHSQQFLQPQAKFNVSPCRARGLSVNTTLDHAVSLLKLPKLSGGTVCRIRLRAGTGRIQQTGRWSHHTWWPLASFDILAACEGKAA